MDAAGEQDGVLAPSAASTVAKVFAAREARPELLAPVGHLSRYLPRWTPECDRRLHQLMCYVSSTLKHRGVGSIGHKIQDLRFHLYSGSDIAGCQATTKST